MVQFSATAGRRIASAVKLLSLSLAAALLLSLPAQSQGYEFKLTEVTTGQELDLALLTEDKPLIVHVWAPDCPHCKRHMPYLVGLYKKLDLDKVNFVTCSMGSRRAALDYVQERRLSFPVLDGDSGKISDSFSSQGWPTTFVFAPGGAFVGTCDTQSSAYINEMLELIDRASRQ